MKSALIQAVSASLFLNDETRAFSDSIMGKCPEYNIQSDFKADAYLGKWYELARSAGTSWF